MNSKQVEVRLRDVRDSIEALLLDSVGLVVTDIEWMIENESRVTPNHLLNLKTSMLTAGSESLRKIDELFQELESGLKAEAAASKFVEASSDHTDAEETYDISQSAA